MLPTCDSRFVQPREPGAKPVICPGHLPKIDTCVGEALWQWIMDGGGASAGDSDFEGHLALMIVKVEDEEVLDEDRPDQRTVIVPAGNYLIWTASSGKVTVTQAATEAVAWVMFNQHAERHALWESGCNPNDPAGHADCEDQCQHPEWIDA